MCSALITVAYSLPIQSQKITDLLQNKSTPLDAKEDRKPLVVIMEDADPKSDSIILQFVYTSNGGNSVIQSTGSEKEKYIVDIPVKEEKVDQTKNPNETMKEKSDQISNTHKITTKQANKLDTVLPKFEMIAEASLNPKEESSLTRDFPKYFYDAFEPIKPFPELQYMKSNQVISETIISKNNDKHLPIYEKIDKKVTPFVAGPQLNPLSIYEREFNVPIFD